MWKDYSWSYIKNNRASSISVMVAAFISALFLSLLCTLFYNFWKYDIERIEIEEGSWQARIEGELDNSVLDVVEKYPNIDKVIINKELSDGQNIVADLYFNDMRRILEDLPQIAELTGIDQEAITCHHSLLSMYLIRDPKDPAPRLVFPFFLAITGLACFSLIMIIHNSFAVSMNARIHQFGIFSSIGATPGQIRTCLMQEAAVLCAAPVMVGILLGIALSYVTKQGIEIIGADMPGRYNINFSYHPAIFAVTLLVSFLTVLFSAWIPARKLSRMTPLDAIRGTGGLKLKKKKHSPVLSLLFGTEGELAGNALKAQKKTLRTSTLSLTLSFLGFTMMLCFFALTDLSTKYTYFEKYQDVWDIMATVKNTKIEDFGLTQALAETEGVNDLVIYQKAEALIPVPEEAISPELASLGGPQAVAGSSISSAEGSWLVKAPIVIMNNDAFMRYCEQLGITPRLDGTIMLNQFWDSLNSNFRHRKMIPFIKENLDSAVLRNKDGSSETADIPILGYTGEAPGLREEYDDYTLVQFIPLSLWEKIKEQTGEPQKDTYIRILAEKGAALDELNALEDRILQLVSASYEAESENRVEEKITNDRILSSYKLIIGSFCTLLAVIGIANVFSYTLGFLRQRKRELAQYMSVGLTPAGIRKLFCIEALVIAGRPVLITLPLTVFFIIFTTKASFLEPLEVLPEIPVSIIAAFSLAIFAFVGLAYYIGGKKVLGCSLADSLRDDSMA